MANRSRCLPSRATTPAAIVTNPTSTQKHPAWDRTPPQASLSPGSGCQCLGMLRGLWAGVAPTTPGGIWVPPATLGYQAGCESGKSGRRRAQSRQKT